MKGQRLKVAVGMGVMQRRWFGYKMLDSFTVINRRWGKVEEIGL